MMKLGIFSWFSYPLPIEERLQMIKQAGFEATSLWWGDENKHLQPEMARKMGLHIDNIHTPFNHPNDLWLDNLKGEDYLNMLVSCVNDCMQHNIPVAVIHSTGFSLPTEITKIGMDRIKRLVDIAENKGIYLAFENLNFLQHLDYIFENIKSEYLGFCYDSGHENCFHHDADCLTRYGSRLLAVHIDDNYGDADTHLLPYDGTVNWKKVKERLNKSKAIDCLTLEVDFNPKHEKSQIYSILTAKEYLALAYERVQNLAMNNYVFSLAKQNAVDEILDFYHSLVGTPGCTWNLDYPNREIVESDIHNDSLYILRDKDNSLISVAAAGRNDELEELRWNTKNPCDLARIGVLSTRQNQGIGTIMLCNVINTVKQRGFDGIRMLVSKSNPSALAMYDKNGFTKCGETFMFDIDFFCYEMVF